MEDGSADRVLSAVSVLEIAIKSGLGKLVITDAELKIAIADLRLRVIPFTIEHAFGLFRLPQRTDIFDRMLVATALAMNVPIVSGDREFSRYEGLKVIWR